jgi:small subunit ribosomal protein S1
MSNPLISNPSASDPELAETSATAPKPEATESFQDVLAQFDKAAPKKTAPGGGSREATVIAVNAEAVVCDIGYKTEGALALTELRAGETLKPGDKLAVTIKGRDPEGGYYLLTRGKVQRPADWESLQKAFDSKATIMGTVTAVVKGGLSVDVGVRAFMPASRSGERDAAAMAKLVDQEIRCRISKLDVDDEDVVVDRRAVMEDEERLTKDRRYSELKEGDSVTGTVRSLAEYGAFVDVGGVDALLHVSDIAWSHVSKPADMLEQGQQVEVRVLKIDAEKKRISVGMKQLLDHPWDALAGKYKVGDRARGTVTRLMDFGAFVELEPGVEGLIHISEMSWGKKVRKTSDAVKPGETVEAVILGVNAAERRIALGLKQALGDPWADATKKFEVGTEVEGPVTSLTKFGAFVQLAEGVEGMIHISDISADKRLNHPSDMLKVGQVVKAVVLELDLEKRRLKLGMKQLVPTGLDEYIGEHNVGDAVTGRIIEISGSNAKVELGEGIRASCKIAAPKATEEAVQAAAGKADLSSLGSMLQARWKSGPPVAAAKPSEIAAGQVRNFRIVKLDREGKKIEVELG